MLSVEHIIESGGLLLITLIVFAESGMLVGFFLPGDTLLFSAGFFASQGKLPLLPLIFLVMLAAMVGDNVGYTIGKRNGHRIFKRKDGVFFRVEYIEKAEKFYQAHGARTVMFARFLPILRTFAPVAAGVGKMPRRKFVFYDILGASTWGAGIILLGNFLGSRIPSVDKYLLPAIILAMAISFGPTLWHLLKTFLENRNKT